MTSPSPASTSPQEPNSKSATSRLTARQEIPAGHKIALRDIAAGEMVHRYSHAIGRAKQPIRAGEHIHTHNLAFEELQLEYEFPATEIAPPVHSAHAPTFLGYAREDGRVGTRNYIAIVAASNCAAHTAESIARSFEDEKLPENVDGIVAFPHGEGCGMSSGVDLDQLRRTLGGVLAHPNVSAALILGLGCEVNQIDHYLGSGHGFSTDRMAGMTVQGSGGTRATVKRRAQGDRPLHRTARRKSAAPKRQRGRSRSASTAAVRIRSPASRPTRRWVIAPTCWRS